MPATTEHTHPTTGRLVVDDDCRACEAEAEAYDHAQDLAYVTAYGICSYLGYLRHCEREAEIHEACLVVGAVNDPITRSASFDAYELAGIVDPLRQRCAAQGCPRCQEELTR